MRIRIVDAFTDQPFAGNPAAVCLLEAGPWPDESWMHQVAAEMALSETAFARPLTDDPDADWDLRWFTPTVEAKMCGHATLATTHAMMSDGLLNDLNGKVRFNSRSGVLIASVTQDQAITMDFPVSSPETVEVPKGLIAALGAEAAGVTEVYRTGPLGDLLVELDDENAVRSAVPDLAAIEVITERDGFRALLLTALADPVREYDFVSRFFAPSHGIPEDPVTGSAHTGLAPYWAKRLGREELVGYQASTRGGLVRVVLAGDRVLLTGQAVTVLDGELKV
ncbi:PhzF family phenazine biosynthesis protein [Kribbella sancticallisti]|uniref:PhzF family phenazine biosynthesis protein n=1 Tax=Kribbella sancticallisti TaxID=460087 RepID=A0ABN2D156_9ACTN